jgi:methionyl-tRNA formyltransferase
LAADADVAPGTVLAARDDVPVAVQTGEGRLGLTSIKLAGKRALPAADFARGQRDFVGSTLGGGE